MPSVLASLVSRVALRMSWTSAMQTSFDVDVPESSPTMSMTTLNLVIE